jgi:hypothetical protein
VARKQDWRQAYGALITLFWRRVGVCNKMWREIGTLWIVAAEEPIFDKRDPSISDINSPIIVEGEKTIKR